MLNIHVTTAFIFSYTKHQPLCENTWAVGKIDMKYLTAAEAQLVSQHYSKEVTAITTFKRLQRNREIFYCQEYKAVKRRNSYTIMYHTGTNMSYGQIMYFIITADSRPSAMVQKLRTLPIPDEFRPVQSVIPVQLTSEIDIVNVTDNIFKCMFLEIGDMCYVVKLFCTLNMD